MRPLLPPEPLSMLGPISISSIPKSRRLHGSLRGVEAGLRSAPDGAAERRRARYDAKSPRWLSTKVLVDGPAAAEAFVDAVPVVDVGFVHAPAEIDFLAAEQRGEIDQAGVEILDQNAHLFDAFDEIFQRLGVGVVLGFPRLGIGGVDGERRPS